MSSAENLVYKKSEGVFVINWLSSDFDPPARMPDEVRLTYAKMQRIATIISKYMNILQNPALLDHLMSDKELLEVSKLAHKVTQARTNLIAFHGLDHENFTKSLIEYADYGPVIEYHDLVREHQNTTANALMEAEARRGQTDPEFDVVVKFQTSLMKEALDNRLADSIKEISDQDILENEWWADQSPVINECVGKFIAAYSDLVGEASKKIQEILKTSQKEVWDKTLSNEPKKGPGTQDLKVVSSNKETPSTESSQTKPSTSQSSNSQTGIPNALNTLQRASHQKKLETS